MTTSQANEQVLKLIKALKQPMALAQKIEANRALQAAVANRDALICEVL